MKLLRGQDQSFLGGFHKGYHESSVEQCKIVVCDFTMSPSEQRRSVVFYRV